jgi:phage shock protein PspC (stress-responsive transcriptional regulator)
MSEYTTQPTENLKRLERSRDSRLVAGVAGGLGRYFDLNPAFFRIGFVVLTLLGGAGILVYLAAVLVVPDEGHDSIAAEILQRRRERPWPVVGLGLAAVALLVLLSRSTFWPLAGAGWGLLLLAGLAIVWAANSESSSRRVRILAGTAIAFAAIVLAAAIAAVVVAFSWFDVSLGDGVGDRSFAPASVRQVEPAYELGIGNLTVDLSSVGPVSAPTRIRAKLGVGELRLIVPPGATVNAHVKAGAIHADGKTVTGQDARYRSPTSSNLVVDATVGAGQIHVERAVG